MSAGQLSLFGREAPSFDAPFAGMQRVHLEAGAWLDVARGWPAGHAPLMEQLVRDVRWRSEERAMYERRVAVPRFPKASAPT